MFYHQTYNLEPFNPKSAEFGVWSTHEIKKLSVAKINTFVCFDNVGYPVAGGLHDARLGPLKFQSDPCLTCGNNMMKCLGHFGHIELPVPVVNPLFAAIVANVLKISCLSCFSAIIREPEKTVLTTQLRLVELGCLVEAHKLDQYLEQYNDKSVAEVKQDMAQLYEKLTATYGADHTPKNIDSVWRHYVGRIFRRGAAKKCPNCKKTLYKVTFIAGRFYISCRTIGKEKLVRTHLMPATIMEHMRKLWPKESDLLKALIKALSSSTAEYPTDLCFISVVPVTPSNTRPIQMVRGKSVEHPKNIMYRQILQDCMQIRNIVQVLNGKEVGKEVETLVEASRGDSPNEKLHYKWHELQINVNALLDANALKGVINTSLGVSRIGVKQLIEKKVGIMRKNMMGKRVDYFARSVITPDPLLNINEIGVPQAFAKKLTFPVPVTPWNVTELREMVMRGPGSYPGANVVEADDGSLIWISETNVESRRGLAKTLLTPRVDSSGPKVVHRHLLDGDMLLINRQPSLHKPSIMAHEARILQKEKTFRLHYANCKAYNADFDGDEMNAHFPQNELARAEASEIMNACHQYLVPRDGTPLSGLIQDHVISAFRLTVRGKFFNRREYHQLVYQALCFLVGDIKLLPPAILKPQCLWSGKQVISTLIINLTPASYVPLNLYSTTKVRFNAWPSTQQAVQYCSYMSDDERKFMSETNVVIRGGELLCGVLDKNHVGATHYGLVHSFYELYGGQYSANILSALSRLLTHYLQQDGFSLGVLDIMVQRKADRQRRKMVDGLEEAGVLAARNALGVPADEEIDSETLLKRLEIAHKKNTNFRALVDHEYKNVLDKITNDVNKVCLPLGLAQPFPANNLQLMVQSGAKGSTVNTMQISCLLGQIELEGKRPPLMISGKSLPSFRPYDPSPVAGGFIASRFMSGIRPQEFFFHCMAGREGLIDTAVKTSRSGYLQRCLVKHLEGLVVNYDLTVRDSDNSVIQFRYGEDGLDIPKSQLLNLEQLPFFADNIDALYNEENFAPLKEGTAKRELRNQKNNIEATKSIRESVDWKKHRDSAFLRFCSEMANESELLQSQESLPGRSNMSYALCNLWYSMHEDVREKYARMSVKCPDPVISNFAPDVYFGSVSENTEEMLRRYFKDNKGNLPVRKSKFKEAVYWKSFTSLCQPGEPVGVLAAQSVGEPSTQMTLNTFHFAGRGEMNVTLGIPRLREILMVASRKIKTPCTEIPFRPDVHRLEKRAEKLRKSLMRVVLRDVLEKITVKEMISSKKKIRKYQLQLHYLPRKSYSSDTNIKPIHIIKCVETRFISSLEQMLKKHLTKNYSGEMKIADRVAKHVGVSDSEDDEDDNFDNEFLAENREKKTVNDDSDDDNSDAEGDGDASEARLRRRQIDGQEYDEDDDDDDDDDDQEFEVSTNFLNEEKNSDDDEIADGPLSTTNTESAPVSRKSKSQFEIITPNFGVKEAQHDPASNSWTKIELWASLSYKRLDLSSLLPKEAGNVVIHEIPGIKRAITYVNNDGLLTLKTEGSYGISELFKHDRLLDLNKLYSNDVHAVADNFGIEAANRVLIREVQDVFKVYGITVDPRHLTLIADYMTFDGTYQGLNRTGMDNCPSPMQQMTFETTLKYLRNATLRNLKDNLQSPSSSIMLGLNSKIGAGLIHLHCR